MSDVVIKGSWMKVRGCRETLCTTFVTSKSNVILKQKVKKKSKSQEDDCWEKELYLL